MFEAATAQMSGIYRVAGHHSLCTAPILLDLLLHLMLLHVLSFVCAHQRPNMYSKGASVVVALRAGPP